MKNSGRGRALLAVLILLGSMLAGCATSGVSRRPSTSPPSGRERALSFLETRSTQFETVHAGLEIAWSQSEDAETVSCRGTLVFVSPDRFRLRGTSSAFFTVFDLIAGRDSVFVDVPREEVVVRGARDDPAWTTSALSPDLLALALMGVPRELFVNGSHGIPDLREEHGVWIAAFGEGTLELDSESGLPKRFFPANSEAAVIQWIEWGDVDDVPWPRQLEFQRASDGEMTRIEFGRVQLGKPVREQVLEEAPESRRQNLGPREGLERWRGALSASEGTAGP